MILGVIDTAKRGSAESSALGYVEAVEKSIMLQQVKGEMAPAAGTYTISNSGKTLTYAKDSTTYTITVDYKGAAPDGSSDSVTIGSDSSVTAATLTFSTIHANVVTYNGTTGRATIAS